MSTSSGLILNFMIVGATKQGKFQTLSLFDVARDVFGAPEESELQSVFGLAANTSKQQFYFGEINQHIATDGDVSTGQVLYLPPKDLRQITDTKFQEIIAALKNINDEINQQSQQVRVYFAQNHPYLAGSAAVLGFSATRALDLSTHNLRIRKQLLDRQLKKVIHHISRAKNLSKAAKRAERMKGPNHAKLHREFKEHKAYAIDESKKLDHDIGRYLRMLNTGDKHDHTKFANEVGRPWSRAIYNARRIGLDSQSLTHITRHMARMLRYAKVANHLGRISIGLGVVVSTTVDTFNECEESQDGWICGRAVAGNAAGFAGGMVGSVLGSRFAEIAIKKDAVENVSKSLLGREIRCNASLDIETEGAGIVICQVMITFAGSYAGGAGLSWMFNKGSRSIYSSIFHMPGD